MERAIFRLFPLPLLNEYINQRKEIRRDSLLLYSIATYQNIMRHIINAAVPAMVATQARFVTKVPFAETAKAAEAPAVVTNNYSLTFNTASHKAVLVKPGQR